VVFVTAYDEHAVAAFEQGAVDYLLKPLTAPRLATAVRRLRERLALQPSSLDALVETLSARMQPARSYMRWITASVGNEVRLITVDEVCYFQADNKVTVVMTPQHDTVIRRPIRELVRELDPATFWQIHRSTVVNVDAIAGMLREDADRQFVLLRDRAERLPVSRQFLHRFRQM